MSTVGSLYYGEYDDAADAVVSIASFAPGGDSTAGGVAVTITGTLFDGDATVTFGGTPATSVVVVGPTTITCVAPAHAAGSVSVTVTNVSAGTSASLAGFVYTTPSGANFPALFIAP